MGEKEHAALFNLVGGGGGTMYGVGVRGTVAAILCTLGPPIKRRVTCKTTGNAQVQRTKRVQRWGYTN